MKNQLKKITHIPNKITKNSWPDSFASTYGIEQYEQQVVNILSALGEINEDFKYAFVTDLSRFECFDINKDELKFISSELGFDLTLKCKIIDVAEKMFKEDMQYIPKDLR